MKLKDLLEKYGEYEVVDETKSKTWYGTLPEEKSGSIQFESREGIQIRLEPSKPKTVWDLEKGDKYYYINADGYINLSTYAEIESEENCVSVGNVFLIYEEAKKDLERRKVETLLLKHGGRRWFDGYSHNYHIGLDEYEEHLKAYILMTPTQGTIYFDNRAIAEKAISEIGEDRIKKALFEVR